MKNPFVRFTGVSQLLLLFLLTFASFPQILIADTSQVSFETRYFELYANILRKVEEGRLDSAIGASARALNGELQKKISPIDARIEQLKEDFGSLSDSERDARLNELMATAAKKERIYNQYNQKLAALLPDRNTGLMGGETKTAPAQNESKIISTKSASPAEKEEESPPVKIKFEPENVMKGDFE